MAINSLLWKLNRLRAMGIPEITYRVKQTFHAKMEQYGIGLACPDQPWDCIGRAWGASEMGVQDVEEYRIAADKILNGQFNVFALQEVKLGFPPSWNRDPKTGIEAPSVFGKLLNYRDDSIVGDIKYLWELNRHAELVTLAQAWYLTGDVRYIVGCRVLLESWFLQCPYPLGANWTSSLEHAVRIVNWAVAWALLSARPIASDIFDEIKPQWLESVYQHLYFISGHFSKYSSANNHLFGEYAGLFIGSVMWPCWKDNQRWKAIAMEGLETEALKQNGADGVNYEQGIWYHHSVADMMLLCGLFGRANGVEFSSVYWHRLEAMMGFIAAMMDVEGNVPMIGDSDDGLMVRWIPGNKPDLNIYRSLLAIGSVLFERHNFAKKAVLFDDKGRWLLGLNAAIKFQALQNSNPAVTPTYCMQNNQSFPDGGYYILGDAIDSLNEIRLIVDAGPLGYLSIASHGHADALAFTLSVAGKNLLIDPGTYAYHTQKKWREYFRGTSAHNTVRVDAMDQSVSGGNFMWLKHARSWCESFKQNIEKDVFVGVHDGYQRLKDPVTHKREIVMDKPSRQIQVVDTIECIGQHHVELFWHFSEQCTVITEGKTVIARNGDVEMRLIMTDDFTPELVSGRENPPLGWVSRRFDVKLPTTTVSFQTGITGTVTLKTEIFLTST